MRVPFTRGRFYAAMALSAFTLLLWKLSTVLTEDTLGWIARSGAFLPLIPLMLNVLLADLIAQLTWALLSIENRWFYLMVIWAGMLPLSYGYVWLGSALWRRVRRRESN